MTEPTPAQIRTLDAYVRTGSYQAAAHDLGVSLHTVKNQLDKLYRTLDASGVLEALNALGWLCVPRSASEGVSSFRRPVEERRRRLAHPDPQSVGRR